jgi:hypothetical protein
MRSDYFLIFKFRLAVYHSRQSSISDLFPQIEQFLGYGFAATDALSYHETQFLMEPVLKLTGFPGDGWRSLRGLSTVVHFLSRRKRGGVFQSFRDIVESRETVEWHTKIKTPEFPESKKERRRLPVFQRTSRAKRNSRMAYKNKNPGKIMHNVM